MTGRNALPRHTTPTWEMELLISCASVFALLQLPGAMDELASRISKKFFAAYLHLGMGPRAAPDGDPLPPPHRIVFWR